MTTTPKDIGPPDDPRDGDSRLAPIGCAALGAAALGLPGLAVAMGLCHLLIGMGNLQHLPTVFGSCMSDLWWLYVVPALIGLGLGAMGYHHAARSGHAVVKWAIWSALVWVAVFGLIVAAMSL